MPLTYRGQFDTEAGVLDPGHNAGFFSNCTVTLWNIGEVLQSTGRWPDRLAFTRGFSGFRPSDEGEGRTDLYPLFFEPPSALPPPTLPSSLPRVWHHGLYRFVDFATFTPVLQHYFRPGAASLAFQRALVARHGIDPARTIAVVYRRTDKVREVEVARPDAVLAVTRRLIERHPGFRVLSQSDEAAVRQLFLAALGDRCFEIPELPPIWTTAGTAPSPAESLPPTEMGVRLVAVYHLLSQCALVVNHTGNMALWICLWRGHVDGVVQFSEAGVVVNFASPLFYLGHALMRAKRVFRRVRRLLTGRR